MPLEVFKSPIGVHQASELNDALYTIYGELSADLHPEIDREAEAIVSTMLNRLRLIDETRQIVNLERKRLETATADREMARRASDEIGRAPSAIKQSLKNREPKWTSDQVNAEYNRQFSAARERYKLANEAMSKAQTVLQKANDKKTAAEMYVASAAQNKSRVTLTDICMAPAPNGYRQYMGHSKGLERYKEFSKLSKPDQERNAQRWTSGYNAIMRLVSNPSLCQPFVEFRTLERGKQPRKGATQIGGNEFW